VKRIYGSIPTDAVAWLDFLRAHRVARIVLLGHSEGAIVATLPLNEGMYLL
jgi:pimeloyl-ACP methyl ester carboxylesterase